jgi:hypothetical protein
MQLCTEIEQLAAFRVPAGTLHVSKAFGNVPTGLPGSVSVHFIIAVVTANRLRCRLLHPTGYK